MRVLERFTERLIARQRAMYADPTCPSSRSGGPRCATSTTTASTRRCGTSCRRSPGTGPSCASGWRTWTRSGGQCCAKRSPSRGERYGMEMPLEALVALVVTFNEGIIFERLSGIETGQPELLDWIDHGWRRSNDDHCRHGHRTPRADTRPLSRRGGIRRARRRARLLRGLRLRASRRSCSCRPGRSSIRGTGRCRSPTSRGTAACSRSTGAATAAPTGPPEPDAYREEEFAADALAVMDATATERAVLVSLSRGAERSLLLAAEHPERVDRMVFIAPALPLPPAPPRRQATQAFDEPRDDYVGWGKWNRHYWLEHYEDFLEFFFSQCFTEPHSTKQREDAVGWGLETDAETLVATQLAPRLADEESVRELLSRIDCPMLVIHGSDDAVRPCASGARLAELANGALTVARGLRPSASCTRPRQGEPAAARLHRAAAAAAPLGARQVARASARSTSPRRSGSATRSATRRSPTSCASSIPTSRSTGWPSIPVTAVLEARGERIHPASADLANESQPHRVRVRRARSALLPGDPADGRDPARELHGLPRPRPRGAVRPLDRRRGLGARLLPAREPRAEAGRVRLADRLRRLAADGRRRRAGGVPDRRLQRRDDRAHRALPARPRPRDLRRQPRRHRARRLRPGPAADPRLDRGALRLRRATSPASTRPTSRTASAPRRARLPPRTSRCASSRSAARASAATSCGV